MISLSGSNIAFYLVIDGLFGLISVDHDLAGYFYPPLSHKFYFIFLTYSLSSNHIIYNWHDFPILSNEKYYYIRAYQAHTSYSLIRKKSILLLSVAEKKMADLPETFVPGFHDENAVRKMKYVPFGNTGLKVSQLAIGTGGFCLAYG